MATFTWYHFGATGPSWTDVAANTFIFNGVGTIATPVTVGTWNDDMHIGNGDPGTDQCGTVHTNHTKYTDTDSFDKGSGNELINDTNLTDDECVVRIIFNDAASVTTTNVRFYVFDSTTTTTEAPGIDVAAFESGVSAVQWTVVNDDTTAAPLTVGSIGGDNAGERLDLTGQGPATDHTFHIAVSAAPETVGAKIDFDFGIGLTYS